MIHTHMRWIQKPVVKQNLLWRSKDERHLHVANKDGRSNTNETGRSQSTAFKSSGLQRKGAGKGAPFESKEPQVETGIIEDATSLNAVVKVFCTHTAPDYSLPWQKQDNLQVLEGMQFQLSQLHTSFKICLLCTIGN
ncbi:hypothetical protein K7X08_005829 [Anisodus acutangulus]|uniref:Uncharacterized protein n=1 Tax=Anisodus acutangulus TaxID=402998 RepID=A0A9Q1R7L6_9SOLA|nr:hypothetical protein K7X08_005829 [Anisodus acutangulus]